MEEYMTREDKGNTRTFDGIPGFPFTRDAFSRMDEREDAVFYSQERLVDHLDASALKKIESLIDQLVIEDCPEVLDLMASWNSHWPRHRRFARLVGLGLNEKELKANAALTEFVLHDLNRDPRLPFPDRSFDVVLNTVSVDYLIRPVEVFREVGRVLKPGGLFLVIFSNRFFPEKVVKVWRTAGDEEKLLIVEDYFRLAGGFTAPLSFVSKGGIRPQEDRYARMGLPADPVYAVYAEREGRAKGIERPLPTLMKEPETHTAERKEKMNKVKETLACPYCGEKLKKWAVPQGPFTEWDNEFMYICFNDACPYLMRGWEVMNRQGNRGISYRLMYYPEKDVCMPVPIFSLQALRESIVD
jgi:SAM-dependent methyltransferase